MPQPKEELINLRSKLSTDGEDYDSCERIELAVLKLLDETAKIRHMLTFFYVMGVLSLIIGVIYAITLII